MAEASSELDNKEVQEESVNPSNAKPDPAGPSPAKTSSRPSSPMLSTSTWDAAGGNSICEGKPSNYLAVLEASVEELQSRAQILIDKVNEGRSKDQTLMKNFNTNLTMKVADLSQSLEDRMYQLYEKNNILLQVRLQELTDIMERIGLLQTELKQVCQTVVTVYKDLGLTPEI